MASAEIPSGSMQMAFLNPVFQMSGCPAAVLAGEDLSRRAATLGVNLQAAGLEPSALTLDCPLMAGLRLHGDIGNNSFFTFWRTVPRFDRWGETPE